jgi:hypothetical protein
MEEEIRKTAILRYIKGESPKAIYESLERPKHWFFKWVKRYESGKSDWYKAQCNCHDILTTQMIVSVSAFKW